MYYFTKQTIITAFNSLKDKIENKLLGVLCIMKVIDCDLVKDNRTYSIKDGTLSRVLDDLCFLDSFNGKYGVSNMYIKFSSMWKECIKDNFIKADVSIYSLIVFLYKFEAFNERPSLNDLLVRFCKDYHITRDTAFEWFTNVQPEIVFTENKTGKAEFKAIFGLHNSTISMSPPYSVNARAGELTRAPFIQTLYAGMDSIKCLLIFREDIDLFYPYVKKNLDKFSSSNENSLQQIYYGAPGTGKSYTVKLFTKGESVVRTTFHPDSDYSTFVGAYKPTTKQEPRYTSLGDKAIKMKDSNGDELMEDRIVYEFVAQAFLQAYVQAWKNYAEVGEEGVPKKQFLVIEEINRGNCAQIFGDLFQLLDRNNSGFSEYYIHADKDMQAFLSKAFEGKSIAQKDKINKTYEEDVVDRVLSGELLLLPNNLYIYATMNTSDQSLFPIDSAFKRRWDWIYVPIANVVSENWKIEVGSDKYDWWDFVQKINKHIYETTNSADKQLGYFFCKAKNKIVSTDTFVNKVVFYLWNDVFKDYGFDSSIFNDEKDENGKETKLSFDKFYRLDDGKTIVVENKVGKFLDNLGVVKVVGANTLEDDTLEDEEDSEETLEVHDGESSTPNGPQRDYSKYSINGAGNYNKRTAVRRVIEMYVGQNLQMTGEQIINVWRGLNLALPNAVESEAEYLAHTANDSVKRGSPIQVNKNDVIYVSNQLNVERMNDFISKVNQQDWGIHIEKISD